MARTFRPALPAPASGAAFVANEFFTTMYDVRKGGSLPSFQRLAMPQNNFEIIPGPGPRSLRITFRGFWTDDTVDRYHQNLRERASAAGGVTQTNRVLLDVKHCVVQSQRVMDRIDVILESYRSQIEHYGVVLPDARLFRLQMTRVMADRPVTFFEAEEEAADWLAENNVPAARALHISS